MSRAITQTLSIGVRWMWMTKSCLQLTTDTAEVLLGKSPLSSLKCHIYLGDKQPLFPSAHTSATDTHQQWLCTSLLLLDLQLLWGHRPGPFHSDEGLAHGISASLAEGAVHKHTSQLDQLSAACPLSTEAGENTLYSSAASYRLVIKQQIRCYWFQLDSCSQ